MAGKAEQDASVLKQMIDWLGIEGDEAQKFFGEMMSRRGHKMVPSWVDGDGSSGSKKEPDNVFGISLGGNESNKGPGWQYGG